MLTTPDHRLLEWIRTKRIDLTPEGSITRLELYHKVEGEGGERLAVFEMADRDEEEDPDDLAQEIWNTAEEDASLRSQGSHQVYIVRAYRGDTREPDEQKSFAIQGKMITSLTGNDTEPPTPRGEMMAEMRMTRELHALIVRMAEHTAGSACKQLELERSENMRLRNVGFEAEKLRQAMLDRQHERDLEMEQQKATNQMLQGLFAMGLQFMPVVMSRWLTPAVPPGAASPVLPPTAAPAPPAMPSVPPPPPAPVLARDATMANLLQTFTPQQVGSLLNTFTDEQKAQFLAIYQSFRDHPVAPPAPPPSSAAPSGSASNTN
jgi:hypothetical protein